MKTLERISTSAARPSRFFNFAGGDNTFFKPAATSSPSHSTINGKGSAPQSIQRFSGSGGAAGGGGAAAPAAGSCRIDVRSTPVVGGLARHLFIVRHDLATGAEHVYRGGPTHGGPAFGNIVTTNMPYVAGAVDWSPGAPSVTSIPVTNSAAIDACLQHHLARIDGLAVPYAPLGPNSNTVVKTLLSSCGLPIVSPNIVVPGFYQAPL